jgi:hypothetical protein
VSYTHDMALRAERKHDWEKRLTEEQEEALIAGIAAFKKAGHDLDLYHEGGKLDVYEPPMTVSLYALTDAFQKEGDAKKVLERWLTSEEGALHYSREPNATTLVRHIETLLESARADVDGLEHSTADELRGSLELGVRAGGVMNLVAIDLARIAAEVKKEREQNERAPFGELVRAKLKAAIARDNEGVLWMRAPTAEERSVARRVVDR